MIAPIRSPMTNHRLEILLQRACRNLQGEPGYWNFTFELIRLTCISDESSNRMRIIAPILSMDKVRVEDIRKCMEANFRSSLDARYCIFQERLWSAFLHPLADLSEDHFYSAIHQVAELARTFGTTFTSGILAQHGKT